MDGALYLEGMAVFYEPPSAPVLYPLSETWEPNSRTRQLLRGRGKSSAEIDALVVRYREEMRGEERARWTSKGFLAWCSGGTTS